MQRILELNDKDIGLEMKTDVNYKPRLAARAVLKKMDKIAILHVAKHKYYKIPGGGIKKGETIEEGLKREILEETESRIKILGEIGEVVEYRSEWNELQTSYCFLAEVIREGEPHFDQAEIDDEFELLWVKPKKAIELMKNSKPNTYDGKFIIIRDAKFIEVGLNL